MTEKMPLCFVTMANNAGEADTHVGLATNSRRPSLTLPIEGLGEAGCAAHLVRGHRDEPGDKGAVFYERLPACEVDVQPLQPRIIRFVVPAKQHCAVLHLHRHKPQRKHVLAGARVTLQHCVTQGAVFVQLALLHFGLDLQCDTGD